MKRFESGEQTSLIGRITFWTVALTSILWSTNSPAMERRLWIWADQPFVSTESPSGDFRHQVNFKGANYSDVILATLSTILDFRHFEVGILFAERNFLDVSDGSKTYLPQY